MTRSNNIDRDDGVTTTGHVGLDGLAALQERLQSGALIATWHLRVMRLGFG